MTDKTRVANVLDLSAVTLLFRAGLNCQRGSKSRAKAVAIAQIMSDYLVLSI